MLGRYHVSISLAIASLLVIPLIFLTENSWVPFGLAFLVAVIIGSLTPDADCKGKAKIHYDFYVVERAMNKVVQPLVKFLFQRIISKKYNLEGEINDEHRGIMHSPIGILISSFLLTIILLLIVLFFNLFNVKFIFAIFFGLLFGQFLHLIEDTCTVSGIKWKFPFKISGELKGNIYTWDKYRNYDKMDIRPGFFIIFFGSIAVIFFFAYAINKITLSLFLLYPVLLLVMSFEIILMFLISGVFPRKEKSSSLWKVNRESIKKLKNNFGNLAKNASRIN